MLKKFKVKNIVIYWKISPYVQFLLLQQCFPNSPTAEVKENVSMWQKQKIAYVKKILIIWEQLYDI